MLQVDSEHKKLERKAGVPHVKGRAFHTFHRAVAPLLVEQLGIARAGMWIGDRPEVIWRNCGVTAEYW